MPAVKLTHFYTHLRSLGGAQSILQRHLVRDQALGFQTDIGIFFEGMEPPLAGVFGAGLTGRDSIRSARAKFLRLPIGADVAIYHNFWGIPFFADLDQARRRIGYLHSDWPGISGCLQAQRGLVDGAICVSQPLRQLTLEHMPELGEDRVVCLSTPITPPKTRSIARPWQDTPIVLGYSGRVSRDQKRVDRFVPLLQQLDAAGINYRMEFLGGGPEEAWLKSRLSSNPRVTFHGRQSGVAYAEILSRWDCIVFTSDYEGLPLSLLEAMSHGVLPIFPKISSGGDDYVLRLQAGLLYPPEDYASLSSLIVRLRQTPDEQIIALRQQAQTLAEPHYEDAYFAAFGRFVQHINSSPPLARPLAPRPAYLTDWWPFGLLRRFYMQGFYRRPTTLPNLPA